MAVNGSQIQSPRRSTDRVKYPPNIDCTAPKRGWETRQSVQSEAAQPFNQAHAPVASDAAEALLFDPQASKATFHLYEASTSATGGKTHTGEFTPTEAASASCDEQPSPSRSRRLRGCVARCSRRALPGYGPHVTPCLPSQHLRDGSHPCKCWAASESGAPMRSVPHSICGLTPQRVIAKNSSLCTLYPMPQSRIQRLVGPGISLCLDPTSNVSGFSL